MIYCFGLCKFAGCKIKCTAVAPQNDHKSRTCIDCQSWHWKSWLITSSRWSRHCHSIITMIIITNHHDHLDIQSSLWSSPSSWHSIVIMIIITVILTRPSTQGAISPPHLTCRPPTHTYRGRAALVLLWELYALQPYQPHTHRGGLLLWGAVCSIGFSTTFTYRRGLHALVGAKFWAFLWWQYAIQSYRALHTWGPYHTL